MSEQSNSETIARMLAFYLPQYHPIPENNDWWGTGFTEWRNAAKAKPLYHGHYQPHIPGDLGYYDLRCAENRIAQANMARKYGIEGFCYYHYWFSGKRLLEEPFNEVLASGEPDFPFCLCWANASWTGIWHGAPNRMLIEQTYPGMEDHEAHFEYMLKAFNDPRYIRVDNKPLFLVYKPKDLPNATEVASLWRNMASDAGLPGIYLVGVNHNDNWDPAHSGFDAAVIQRIPHKVSRIPWKFPLLKLSQIFKKTQLTIYDYKDIMHFFVRDKKADYVEYPCAIPNWDNTPRSGMNGLVLHNSTPEYFRQHLKQVLSKVSDADVDNRIVFLKSWNEWAEGNYVEPDLRYGKAYLEVIKDVLFKKS